MNNGFHLPTLWNGSLARLMPEWFDAALEPAGIEPAVDVTEDAEAYVVRAELPGVAEKDVQVSFEDGTLTIRGERRSEVETKETRAHVVERRSGSFVRSFRMPGAIAEGKVGATLKNGVLTVLLPKREEAKPRSIEVRPG